MQIIPTFTLTILNGFLLIIPLFLIRFGLASFINKKSLPKLTYFPEVLGIERIALKTYFITNTFLIFSPIVNPIVWILPYSVVGLLIYLIGILFIVLSMIRFSKEEGIVNKGIYNISRNPMYLGYFTLFLGTSILINSIIHIILTIIYQIAVHYLILSEERWCKETYQQEYLEYFKKVPRYFLFF